jgi:hypothetical protein
MKGKKEKPTLSIKKKKTPKEIEKINIFCIFTLFVRVQQFDNHF